MDTVNQLAPNRLANAKASAYILLTSIIALAMTLYFWPTPHPDLYQVANQMGLQGPERERFVMLVEQARHQAKQIPAADSVTSDSKKQIKQQLLSELAQFLTPYQLDVFERHCEQKRREFAQVPL
ncbi:hypothetical protein IC617_16415 [Neiella sp. HB171785]|uniref:Uncharacterized protein n=1 Tax=Neiella litorisoli TaxID=2771431 RepID=A0A8J6QKM5_9GAMM|nr:hypothetical protein [Neiella litorisoli]MBD1391014.1 hypothetical protein [Neiella litorisoli]